MPSSLETAALLVYGGTASRHITPDTMPKEKAAATAAQPPIITVEQRQLITVIAAKAEHRTQYSEYAHSGFYSQEFLTEGLNVDAAKAVVAAQVVSTLNAVMDAHRKDIVEKKASSTSPQQ